jgi:hypothetical protein
MVCVVLAALTAAVSPVPQASAAVPPTIHYTFDGTLNDQQGASTLTLAPSCPNDPCNATTGFGSDAQGDFWAWSSTDPRGGGFTIDTAAPIGTTYTLALKFSFAAVDDWRKIVDYQDRASDNGFYFHDALLNFYPFDDESASTYPPNTVLDLIAVRQATGPLSGTFTVYAIGTDSTLTELFSTDDPTGESIPIANGSGGTMLGFFFDDLATVDEATPSGKVYDLRIWANRALTEEDLQEALLPPDPPTDVTGEPGDRSVTVSWAPVAGATSYVVTAQPGGATCTAVAPATSCVVEGLVNGTTYTFTVVAIGDGGTSDPSEPSNPVTPRPDPVIAEITFTG